MMLAHSNPTEHLFVTATAIALVGLYLWSWTRSPAPRGQAVAFCLGLATSTLATSSPAERIMEPTFTGHMVQHLLLSLVVPPLIVLGHPLRTLLGPHGVGRPRRLGGRRRTERTSPGAILSLVAWSGSVVVLLGLHTTPVYDAALTNPFVHALTHVSLVGTGIVVWATVLRPGSRRVTGSRPLTVGLALGLSVPVAVLGIWLTTARRPLSDIYVRRLGWDRALADQHAGGALMRVLTMIGGVVLTITAVLRWAQHEQRVVERLESLTDSAQPSVDGREAAMTRGGP